MSYSDTNYDDAQVNITLTGAMRKGVALDGSYADQHNGKVFTFKNFAKEKDVDDIYTLAATLTDKAGNTTEKTILFSVNRFGSTYALSAATEQLNGSYVQTPQDVVVTETNPDALQNIRITLFKNNQTIILQEGMMPSTALIPPGPAWSGSQSLSCVRCWAKRPMQFSIAGMDSMNTWLLKKVPMKPDTYADAAESY